MSQVVLSMPENESSSDIYFPIRMNTFVGFLEKRGFKMRCSEEATEQAYLCTFLWAQKPLKFYAWL